MANDMSAARAARAVTQGGLTPRQELFCAEYLKDLNAAGAAQRAGYANVVSAYELLAMPKIQERIAVANAERLKRVQVSADDIVRALKIMLETDPLKYVNEDGSVKTLAEIPEEARLAIASFEVDTVGSAKTVTRTRVKFWSKEKAAELLGKHLTLFKEVMKVEGLEDLAEAIYAGRNRVGDHEAAADDPQLEDLSPEELV